MTRILLVEDNEDILYLLRLQLDVYVDNAPAVRLYKRFGFEVEATHRQFGFRAGRYVDTYAMARFKGDA